MSGRRPQAVSRSRLSYFQLRPEIGPLGICLGELSLAAGRSAVTFSRVHVAQQLELPVLLARQHVDALQPRA